MLSGKSKSFEIACRFIPICNYMHDLGAQILICRGSVLDHNNLSSHKARGCLRFLQRHFQRLGDGLLAARVTADKTRDTARL